MLDVDHTKDLRKYTQTVDGKPVAGLVKHLGIALKGRDSSFVACSDSSERDRVREHFLNKKLGLTMPDAELDEAIVEICQRMAKDRDKHRVTFYYLLAEKYGKLAALSK